MYGARMGRPRGESCGLSSLNSHLLRYGFSTTGAIDTADVLLTAAVPLIAALGAMVVEMGMLAETVPVRRLAGWGCMLRLVPELAPRASVFGYKCGYAWVRGLPGGVSTLPFIFGVGGSVQGEATQVGLNNFRQ